MDTVQGGVPMLHKGPCYLIPLRAAIFTSIISQQYLCCLHPSLSSEVAMCIIGRADPVINSGPGFQETVEPC